MTESRQQKIAITACQNKPRENLIQSAPPSPPSLLPHTIRDGERSVKMKQQKHPRMISHINNNPLNKWRSFEHGFHSECTHAHSTVVLHATTPIDNVYEECMQKIEEKKWIKECARRIREHQNGGK